MKHIYVIGDSISIQYGPHLEAALDGHFACDRKRGDEAMRDLNNPRGANGGDSSMVLSFLQEQFASGSFKPDVLLLNCGLHDIKYKDGRPQVSLDEYRKNLEAIVALCRQHGLELVWIRTTGLKDHIHNNPEHPTIQKSGFFRYEKDQQAYNAAADAIMQANDIFCIDLEGFTNGLGGEDIFCDHVHFTESVRQQQGSFIARQLIERYANN